MKMCNTEIMKKIKLLEQQKHEVASEETRICQVTYQTDNDKIDYGYSFADTRNRISKLNGEVRRLKHLLNYSNATTVVEGFGMTLGECLVYMAQLNNERDILERFSYREPSTRRPTANGVIEYTVLNYGKTECQELLKEVKETIMRLQIAIGRTNLTHMIEV